VDFTSREIRDTEQEEESREELEGLVERQVTVGCRCWKALVTKESL
jgi:hypothetical protein